MRHLQSNSLRYRKIFFSLLFKESKLVLGINKRAVSSLTVAAFPGLSSSNLMYTTRFRLVSVKNSRQVCTQNYLLDVSVARPEAIFIFVKYFNPLAPNNIHIRGAFKI